MLQRDFIEYRTEHTCGIFSAGFNPSQATTAPIQSSSAPDRDTFGDPPFSEEDNSQRSLVFKVAVKTLKRNSREKSKQDFIEEAKTLAR